MDVDGEIEAPRSQGRGFRQGIVIHIASLYTACEAGYGTRSGQTGNLATSQKMPQSLFRVGHVVT
jgi:hypothetical protein